MDLQNNITEIKGSAIKLIEHFNKKDYYDNFCDYIRMRPGHGVTETGRYMHFLLRKLFPNKDFETLVWNNLQTDHRQFVLDQYWGEIHTENSDLFKNQKGERKDID